MGSVAVISMHTSPLVQPGTGDSGGMNVYVRELSASLAQAGVDVKVYVRTWAEGLPERVAVEPGVEVVHIPAGPVDLPKEDLPSVIDEFADGVAADLAGTDVDVLHANYWLSAVAAHRHQAPCWTCPWWPPSTPWPGSRPRRGTRNHWPGPAPRPR